MEDVQEKRKSETPERSPAAADGRIVAFRPRFWKAFYTIFALDCFFSALLVAGAVTKLVRPDWRIPPYMFVIVTVMGLGFIASSLMCGTLLVSVAQLLRYARNQEVRSQGVIGARNIDQYTANEEKREEKIRQSFSDGWEQLGQDVKKIQSQMEETRTSMHTDLERRFRELSEMYSQPIEALSSQVKAIAKKIADSPPSPPNPEASGTAASLDIAKEMGEETDSYAESKKRLDGVMTDINRSHRREAGPVMEEETIQSIEEDDYDGEEADDMGLF